MSEVIDRVIPVSLDDAELTGETSIEEAVISGSLTVTSWPTSGLAGFSDTGELEGAAAGSDYAMPAPIVVYNTDGSETYYGSFTNTSDQNGDALESAFPLGAGKSMKLAPVSFTSIAADLLVSNNCTVEGSGWGTFVQLDGGLTTSLVSVFANAAGSGGNSGIRIANMTIDGNNTENTDTSKRQNGVNLVACDGCVVEGIRAQHFGRVGTDSCMGVRLAGCSDTRVLNSTFIDVVDGVNTLLSGATLCKRLTIANNTVESTCRDYGLTIYQIEDSVIANNVVAECQKNGIQISWASNCVFTGNVVRNCGREANATYPGIQIGTFGPTNNTLIGNVVRTAPSGNQQSYGITVALSAINTTLIGNDFANSGATGAILDSSTTTRRLGNITADATMDAAESRTSLGLVIGTNVQAWTANLDTWGAKTPYAGTAVITTGKTLTASNTLTLAGTDGSTLTIGTGGTLGTGAYAAAFNPAIPGAIGGTTPAAGTFTSTVIATGGTFDLYQVGDAAASNYERLRLTYNAGQSSFQLLQQNGGTGSERNTILGDIANAGGFKLWSDGQIDVTCNGTTQWVMPNSGHLMPNTTNAKDLGGTSNRIRDLYLGRNFYRSVTAAITASTTQTQGQGALTTDINEVATVANANDTVTLPAAAAGMRITIINNGANTLRIYPASGDNAGAGVDTAVTLATATNVSYVAFNATSWEVD